MTDSKHHERQRMVEKQIMARGVRSPAVLQAVGKVRREGYVPSYLGEFAYSDTPLPIEEEQTISQPYIVAFMVEALRLEGHERVLEIGTGSGYAAAVLAEIATEVYTIERHESLARTAEKRLGEDGYTNVQVRCGDGTLGWPNKAPFDAIIVAAGGPIVPDALRDQLKLGGRLVIPTGPTVGLQKLLRITRTGPSAFETEELAEVRFVPLVGEEGWHAEKEVPTTPRVRSAIVDQIVQHAEAFTNITDVNLDGLIERIGDARVVLLGEASHGTSEFYAMRARITQELIRRKSFNIVAVEADWPDAARIDHYVRDRNVPPSEWQAFARFPTWMWRNLDVMAFVDWLHQHNAKIPQDRRVRFAGLDLYALYTSIAEVLRYLDSVDPTAANVARQRYACLTPWQSDPAAYGHAALRGHYQSCESGVVQMLEELLSKRFELEKQDDEHFWDAIQNARLVANAEAYYRSMYYGSHESWNLRDRHMFDTLRVLLETAGPASKAVVWEHNSHIGDARATEMSARGEFNVGELCRRWLGDQVYSIGFGTDHGTVAAASNWGGPMEVKTVRPSHEKSYEQLCHQTGLAAFLLPLRHSFSPQLHQELREPRLERAIGVIYRPETELASHYFQAVLPRQFDEYIWFDETEAVRPLDTRVLEGVPDTYPFGL